jgi:hypothetical protein
MSARVFHFEWRGFWVIDGVKKADAGKRSPPGYAITARV